MFGIIDHQDAISLEWIVRDVYKCGRGGAMGIADADNLERNPVNAAIVAFAPIVKERGPIEEITNFIDTYSCVFSLNDEYKYDKKKTKEYIDTLRKLVDKYYG